jgi:hypothetical protein
MSRRLRPLPPHVALGDLLRGARPSQTIGAWLGGRCRTDVVVARLRSGCAHLLIGSDLAELLAAADRVLTWDGQRVRALPGAARQRSRSSALSSG